MLTTTDKERDLGAQIRRDLKPHIQIHLFQEIHNIGKFYMPHTSDPTWNTEFKYGILTLKRKLKP